MTVEQNMAELNTTWWDLLQKIAFNLDWTYAALWTLTADSRSVVLEFSKTNYGQNLIWKQGYFHMRRNDDANAELFHSLYSSCTFTPGVGFAGHALAHMTNSILWLSGDDLDSLEHPVANQTRFLTAAGIQTVVCLPLGLPSSSYVLELGTVTRIRETEDLAHDIKKVLLCLLADGLPNLINESTAAGVAHQPASDLFAGHIRASQGSPQPPSSVAVANTTLWESARKYASSFSPSSFEGGIVPKMQRQLGPNIYTSEMSPSMENTDAFARQIAQGILNVVPPQLSVEIPELTASTEPSPGERFTSPFSTESSLSQMEFNAFQSWTSMAEATSTLDVALRGLRGTTSATSSRLAAGLNDEIGQMLPYSSTLEQFMAAADQQQQQQQSLLGTAAGASLRGSSSRSSMSLRSQNVEDNEISSAVLEGYGELENVPHGGSGGGGGGGSSSSTMHGESESNWRGGAPFGSNPSSKETSPDSSFPLPQKSYGIHPRISSTTGTSRQQQQPRVVDLQDQQASHHVRHGGTPTGPSQQQQSFTPLERQHSSVMEQIHLQQDRKAGPSEASDSTLRLIQFGNVLQLGNAAGQVAEALPQEHDEAAVSHMLAERRRRNKQNENFSQLKFLIPSAVKMDKASVLAATIAYIHELKEKVKLLEESNLSLKNQLLGGEQDQSSADVGPLNMSSKAKGSPSRIRLLRSTSSLSPTDEDKIQVSPDGDGNLIIEIRNPCSQPDAAMHIFACLREMHFKVLNYNVTVNDNRIRASITVKMKRKNSAGQSAVCAEVEQAIRVCLNNLG